MSRNTRWMEEGWLVPLTPIPGNHEPGEHEKMLRAHVKQTGVEWARWACLVKSPPTK